MRLFRSMGLLPLPAALIDIALFAAPQVTLALVLGQMIFYDSSTQAKVSSLNEQTSDEGRQSPCNSDTTHSSFTVTVGREFCVSDHDGDKSVEIRTHSLHTQLEKDFPDRFRSPACSPLGGDRTADPLSPSTNDQSQLHRRHNRHRKIGSRSEKENDCPPPVLRQSGKTYTAKARRPVLADVTKAYQDGSESFDDVPFANSTSIQSPSRKVSNAEPWAAGLKIEPDHERFLGKSQETVTVPMVNEILDRPTHHRPESSQAGLSTPLHEALAAFNAMLSSTVTTPSRKSTFRFDSPNTFLSFLPASPVATGASFSKAFNLSTLADSISQLTEDIAASIAARCGDDCLYDGQYHEDAVARDERFHWEEEMRCLEVHCGL